MARTLARMARTLARMTRMARIVTRISNAHYYPLLLQNLHSFQTMPIGILSILYKL